MERYIRNRYAILPNVDKAIDERYSDLLIFGIVPFLNNSICCLLVNISHLGGKYDQKYSKNSQMRRFLAFLCLLVCVACVKKMNEVLEGKLL